MKKSFIVTLFLVLSSFFFVSIKEVEADEINYNLDSLYDYDSEEWSDRLNAINDALEQNPSHPYVVYFTDNKILFFNVKPQRVFIDNSSLYIYCENSNIHYSIYKYDNGSLTSSSGSSTNYYRYDYSNLSYTIIKYVNFEGLILSSSSSQKNLVYSYNNFTLSFSRGESFLTLFDFYTEYKRNNTPVDPHEEEKEVIANFYTICIEKIKYLGEQIVSNYIYLSMLVILILIFIIELIRRWLM